MSDHLENLENFNKNIKRQEFTYAEKYDVYIYLSDRYDPTYIANIVKDCLDMSSDVIISELKSPFNKYHIYCVINGSRRRDFVNMLKNNYKKYQIMDHFEVDDNYIKVVIK